LPPTRRMPQGVPCPSRTRTTANSWSLGLILPSMCWWWRSIQRIPITGSSSTSGLSRNYSLYCLFFLACKAQAARNCSPLSVLFDRKAAQVLILKYNSYSFLQQAAESWYTTSTLRHKCISYMGTYIQLISAGNGNYMLRNMNSIGES